MNSFPSSPAPPPRPLGPHPGRLHSVSMLLCAQANDWADVESNTNTATSQRDRSGRLRGGGQGAAGKCGRGGVGGVGGEASDVWEGRCGCVVIVGGEVWEGRCGRGGVGGEGWEGWGGEGGEGREGFEVRLVG